ncbi:MAG TPA: RNA-binding S4 domain-containing protein [Chitinophagales bacterium]|nr:RNA-binding S4 domain-containing protein [Chitinophagales bacterium]HMU68717.1 RNA-binding S4 domain-containing protein [Chitinophagales bacterium]HMX03513.1 RNA-binding S4 domain-containing protein [Chitinophagales bacterium]HMZ88971.1 RNA-binding S4 domain-containing protein [Chitinophagales bacterium]HNA57742.1 RNA-binding S4 domain-containing protein [Chitinophagales bacterium]
MPEHVTKTRIDKWLWAVRLYKTRSLATEAVKNGKVKVNGDSVKPSFEVFPGLILTIPKGVVKYQYKVLAPLERRVGAPLVKDYMEDVTPEEEKMKLTTLEFMPTAFREKGTGRPTKKERRDLDDWMETE